MAFPQFRSGAERATLGGSGWKSPGHGVLVGSGCSPRAPCRGGATVRWEHRAGAGWLREWVAWWPSGVLGRGKWAVRWPYGRGYERAREREFEGCSDSRGRGSLAGYMGVCSAARRGVRGILRATLRRCLRAALRGVFHATLRNRGHRGSSSQANWLKRPLRGRGGAEFRPRPELS